MPVHVDLPIAKAVQVRPLADGSFPEAKFHLSAGDAPLFHPRPAMFQDHNTATLGRSSRIIRKAAWGVTLDGTISAMTLSK